MKKYVFIIGICLFSPFISVIGQQSPNTTKTYPEFLSVTLPFQNTFYNFDPNTNNMTITRTFKISEFRDVTFADVFIQQSGSLIDSVSISMKLNGQNAINKHSESNLYDQETLLFILDENAMIIPQAENTLTFFIFVSFKDKASWDYTSKQSYSIRFNTIRIDTAYRQQIDTSSKLNQTNSQFTALIIDPSYQIATPGFIANSSNAYSLFTYNLEFYIILPKNIKSNYYLNITFDCNYPVNINSLSINQFSLQTYTKSDTKSSYTFRYVDNHYSSSLVKGVLKFNPKNAGIYYIDLTGHYFITNNYKLFPGGPEMDFFLFINATLVIPLLFLSKLIYKRLFY